MIEPEQLIIAFSYLLSAIALWISGYGLGRAHEIKKELKFSKAIIAARIKARTHHD